MKCRSKKEKKKEKRKKDGDYPLFDPAAVCCQYLMAERFVKSILDWKCPIPKEEYRDIADVILRRLGFIIEYTPIDNGDRKSQQMRFLADVISCWISGVLLEVAEAHKKELEEECVRRKQAEEEETEDEEGESEEETERTFSRKSDEESEDEKEDKEKDEEKEDEGNQKKKSEKESVAETEEQNVIQEGEAEEELMSDNEKADEETEKINVEEEEAGSQIVEEKADENKILEEAEIARKRAEEEELARKQVEEEAEMKRLEEEEAEKKRLEEAEVKRKRAAEEEAEAKRIEEAENARLEEEKAEMKKPEEEAEKIRAEEGEAEKIKAEEEAEKIRVEEEAEQKKIEEATEKENKEEEEAESNRNEEEALEEGKLQEVDQSASTDEMDLRKPVEKSIPETKEFIPIEKGPPIKVFQSDLPFVTFIKICNTIYNMIENEKGNTGQDPVINRLHRSVYEMFQNAVLTQNPSLLTDNAKDVIDVMAGKIATWLSKVLTESQVLLFEKYPPEAESKEVRDWSNWIDHTTETAGNWSLWLQKLIEEVKKMQDNKVTRGQWEVFTHNLNKNAFLWRRFHLDTVHKAHHNIMMHKDREVVKTGEKKTPDYPERELNVFNLE